MSATAEGASLGHVCVFTSVHPTDDVRVHSKITASLLQAGYSVTWIGPGRAYFAPSVEVDPRVNYHLVPPAKSRLGRLGAAYTITRAARDLGPIDWWYSPDPDSARAATALARRRGGRVIFDIHEIFHGALLDRWLYGRRLRAVRALVRWSIARTSARSDLVIGVSSAVLAPYVGARTNSLVIRNCAPEWFSQSGTISDSPAGGPMRVMHGKVIPSNGTPVVLAALELLDSARHGVEVLMFDVTSAGDPFAASVRAQLASSDLSDSVKIVSGVPHEEMPELLRSADVGMIAYGRGLGEDSLPNRLFEYMAAGLAILAPSYATEICEILRAEDIGITADFDDPGDVARALTWLQEHPLERQDMGRRARQAFLERHSWQQEFSKLNAAMIRSEQPCAS